MKKTMIICIVDDDEIYHFTTLRNIEKLEIAKKVLTFFDGEEAINYLKKNLSLIEEFPDIIFLDLNMPVMDGWDFLKEFVKIKNDLVKKPLVYIVSSSINPSDIEKAKQISEISDFLVKPINQLQFKEILMNLNNNLFDL